MALRVCPSRVTSSSRSSGTSSRTPEAPAAMSSAWDRYLSTGRSASFARRSPTKRSDHQRAEPGSGQLPEQLQKGLVAMVTSHRDDEDGSLALVDRECRRVGPQPAVLDGEQRADVASYRLGPGLLHRRGGDDRLRSEGGTVGQDLAVSAHHLEQLVADHLVGPAGQPARRRDQWRDHTRDVLQLGVDLPVKGVVHPPVDEGAGGREDHEHRRGEAGHQPGAEQAAGPAGRTTSSGDRCGRRTRARS